MWKVAFNPLILAVLFFNFNFRHIVFAESSTDSYSSATFPGLVDGMFEIEGGTDEERRWEIVKKHFSVVLHTIDSAISTLRDVSSFMPLSDGL